MPRKSGRLKRRAQFRKGDVQHCCATSDWSENDLDLCITNYFKMTKPKASRVGTSRVERAHWTPTLEIAFAQMLLDFKRLEMLTQNNMQSIVCPEIAKKLNLTYATSFTSDQVRTKYYKFMHLTNLYKELRMRATGLGWSEELNLPIMDDDAWETLIKEDSEYAYFKDRHCQHFDMLCEIFQNQGATGKYVQDSTQPPMDTDEEREMGFDRRQCGKDKVPLTVDSDNEKQEKTVPQTNTKKKGKAKRKTSEQSSEDSPFDMRSKKASEAYMNYMEALTSHFSVRSRSSMSGSFASPTPTVPTAQDTDPFSYEKAVDALLD